MADLSLAEAVAATVARMGERPFSYVVTPNVDHVVALRRTPPDRRGEAFRMAYQDADLVLCDSQVLARLILDGTIPVAGRRVLDFAAGGGLAAIAAARAAARARAWSRSPSRSSSRSPDSP